MNPIDRVDALLYLNTSVVTSTSLTDAGLHARSSTEVALFRFSSLFRSFATKPNRV